MYECVTSVKKVWAPEAVTICLSCYSTIILRLFYRVCDTHLGHLVDTKTVMTKRAVVMSSVRLDPHLCDEHRGVRN